MSKSKSALFVLAAFLVLLLPGSFAQDYQVARVATTFQAQNLAAAQIAVQPVIAENIAVANISSSADNSNTQVSGETSGTSEGTVATVAAVSEGVISTPLRSRIRGEVKEIREEVILGLANATNVSGQEIKSNVRAEIRERLSDAPAFVRRVVAVEAMSAARQRYQEAKENYASMRDAYETQRDEFVRVRQQYRDCERSDTENCSRVRENIKTEAKEHLLNSADLIIKELERVKEKVQSSEDLSESEIAAIVSEIDAKISEVKSARETIGNLDGNSTREDINNAAKTVRESWLEIKASLKKHIARLMNARLGNIIHSTEMLEKRLYAARDKLEAKGADVSSLDAKLSEFSSKLDTAAGKYREAVEKFGSAKSASEVDEAAKDVHTLLTEAKQALKDARDLLRDIVSEIKRLNSGSLDVVPAEAAEVTA